MAGFKISAFSGTLENQQPVRFLVIRMTKSFLIWIGDDSQALFALAVAMPPPIPASPKALSSNLMGVGGNMGALSETISQKLARRSGCQVFVSVNLKSQESGTEIQLLRRILAEMSASPESFFEPELTKSS